MTWNELIAAVAAKTGRSQTQTRELLDATMEQIVLALAEGEKVPLKGVGVLSSVWREARTVRSITNRRRMMVDGRYLPRFRPAQAMRERLALRTPQVFRSPRHQEAWRVAETLIGDLDLYHRNTAPTGLNGEMDDVTTRAACREAFGSVWDQVTVAFEKDVPAEIRAEFDHLTWAARRRWGMPRT